MKKFLLALTVALAAVGFASGAPQLLHAADDQNDFEIQPILPDDQLDKSANYFSLQTKAGMSQTLQMRVQNFTGKTITVKSQLRNAYTQTGGGVAFTADAASLAPTLKQPMTDLIKLEAAAKSFKLGPHEVKVLTATLQMPDKLHTGLIYGDWFFTEAVRPKQGKSTAVTANYTYSLGIALWGKKRTEIHPYMKYRRTEPFLHNKHPALAVTLANVNPMMVREATVQAAISRVGDSGMTRTFSSSNVKIAPNSELRLPISWNYDTMEPGTYRIKAVVSGRSYVTRMPMTWRFSKTFRVGRKTATKLNQQAVKKPRNYWLYASFAVGALWLAAIGGLIWLFAVRPR